MCVCVSILYHQDRYPVLCFLYSEDQKKKTELCKHMRKESECYFTLIFLLKFLNCCLPEQIFNYNWIILEEEKKKKLCVLLIDGAETQVNELENSVASCPLETSWVLLCY